MTLAVLRICVMVCVCREVYSWQVLVPQAGPMPSTPSKQDPQVLVLNSTEERFNLIFPGSKKQFDTLLAKLFFIKKNHQSV